MRKKKVPLPKDIVTVGKLPPISMSYRVYRWMSSPHGLDLGAARLSVYALLYELTEQGSKRILIQQEEMAQGLGVSLKSVNRAIASLGDDGLITTSECARARHELKGFRSPLAYGIALRRVRTAISNMAEHNL